jgi:hypothetical protein
MNIPTIQEQLQGAVAKIVKMEAKGTVVITSPTQQK